MDGTVLLGITGGIAAYKTPLLVRLLKDRGMDVHVIMTQAAKRFTTRTTLAAVSENRVHDDMWADPGSPSIEHIALAEQADLAVIAPATANLVGKMAAGIADDLLTTTLLAITCPTLICPAMNVKMYRNPVVQSNIKKLEALGHRIMAAESGYLVCGTTGEGRMPEPARIADEVSKIVGEIGIGERGTEPTSGRDLEGERILVTAGPTEEPIDFVRFLTNHSSGKMGVAIAKRAQARGAATTLVAGPLKTAPPPGVRHVPIRTALEMKERVDEIFPEVDTVIKAAAVADFRPRTLHEGKVKKGDLGTAIELVKNPDILMGLGGIKRDDQVLVGFAAETSDIIENGRAKLKRKNLDMLVLNDVGAQGAGFNHDTNIVRFIHRSGEDEQMDIMSKESVADLILDRVIELRKKKKAGREEV